MDTVKTSPRFGFRSLDTGLAVSFDDATKQIIDDIKSRVELVPQDLAWDDSWTAYLNEVYPKAPNCDVADEVLMRAFFAALDAGNNGAADEILKLGIINRTIGNLFSIYVLPSQN